MNHLNISTETTPSKNSYFSYFTFGLKSYIDFTLNRIRLEILNLFVQNFADEMTQRRRLLDVGVSDLEHPSSNMLEQRLSSLHEITGLGLEDFSHLEKVYPHFKFVKGNGLSLPFSNESFDFGYSHAVIEHVHPNSRYTFLSELYRVSRQGVFLTTPCRWHPLEFHTGLPLIHFLPQGVYQKIFKALGKSNYDDVSKLSLLTRTDLIQLLKELHIHESMYSIKNVRWLGFISHYILIIKK